MGGVYQNLAQGGYGSAIPGLAKSDLELRQARTKQAQDSLEVHNKLLTPVVDNPTEQQALTSIQNSVNAGYDPQLASQEVARVKSFGGDPQKIKDWANMQVIGPDVVQKMNRDAEIFNTTQGQAAFKDALAAKDTFNTQMSGNRDQFNAAQTLYNAAGGDKADTPITGPVAIKAMSLLSDAFKTNPRMAMDPDEYNSYMQRIGELVRQVGNQKEIPPELSSQIKAVAVDIMRKTGADIANTLGTTRSEFAKAYPTGGDTTSQMIGQGMERFMDKKYLGSLRRPGASAEKPAPATATATQSGIVDTDTLPRGSAR